MALFRGAGVALVTPFHADGSVNYDKLAELIEEQIAGGTDAIIACGTTGEAATMSEEEHMDVIRFIIKAVNHRIPVIAGTGSNCTATAIDLSKQSEEAGADGVLLVTPYYNKATQGGLIQHYEAVAGAISLPCILYNVPSRTGVNIAPDTCRQLADHPNIVAIKEASGNISQVAQIAQLCGDRLDLYSGNDDQIVPMLSLGAKGVISVLANIMPRQTHEICQLFFDGRVEQSRRLQLELLELTNALFSDVNPIPVKEALNLMGMDCGECRLPLTAMQPQAREHLAELLNRHHLIP